MSKQGNTGYFRRQSWDGQVSLEYFTERVPDESRYYILVSGEVVAAHRTLQAATADYHRRLADIPPGPPEQNSEMTPQELVRREREQKHLDKWLEFWADKDGRGRRMRAPGKYR